jgi:hypothetical protein
MDFRSLVPRELVVIFCLAGILTAIVFAAIGYELHLHLVIDWE